MSALPLPALIETLCEPCGGYGANEYATVGAETVTERCETCQGKGTLEVCSGCGEVPTVDTDECGCNRVDPEVLWAMANTNWLEAA